ncbi:MAG: hypothetical protein ACR2HG_00400 [Pyrinomonadaceae bacterium]
MGQLVIEVPQNINLKFSVKSAAVADEILRLVEKPKKLETIQLNYPYDMDDINAEEAVGIWADREETADETPAIIPPRRNNLKEDLANAVGIWADREESADEIARRIRDKNNGKL